MARSCEERIRILGQVTLDGLFITDCQICNDWFASEDDDLADVCIECRSLLYKKWAEDSDAD